MTDLTAYLSLASYRQCAERISANWPQFLAAREDLLRQQVRYGAAAEKVTEAILASLFTQVLDWDGGDLGYQVGTPQHYKYHDNDSQIQHHGRADIVLTKNFIKYLVVETKRPGALAWNQTAVDKALHQVRQYADNQRVSRIAVSDGMMLYAADIEHGVQLPRLFVRLDRKEPPLALWWISVHGVYRQRDGSEDRALVEQPQTAAPVVQPSDAPTELLHPKYKLPARCFGYVGNAGDPRTWKLPHLDDSGMVDEKRLPKAIQAIISNYRGVKVGGIPEPAIPDVLVKLAQAAARLGKLPGQGGASAPVYEQLSEVLNQLGRLNEVLDNASR